MLYVVMRALLSPQPGCKLKYDCPLGGGSYKSEEFFKKYRGKPATFVGYSEKLVGPLDFKGRIPGRYLNPEDVKVRFDGEQEERELNIQHFIMLHPREHDVMPADFDFDNQRLGDLVHPVLYYPGDLVLDKETGKHRTVQSVFLGHPFTLDGVPRYDVAEVDGDYEARIKGVKEAWSKKTPENRPFLHHVPSRDSWNKKGGEISPVLRGNVWALYHDPSKLSFKSDEDEVEFWTQDGITYLLPTQDQQYLALAMDIIERREWDRPVSYAPRRLHDCFAQHRDRVRTLTKRVLADKPTEAVA